MTPEREKEILTRFEKLFWEHRVPRNTKQSKDIKEFILSELRARDTEVREVIEKVKTGMSFDEYLPKVQAWNRTYDAAFDDGYAQTKKDLLSRLFPETK